MDAAERFSIPAWRQQIKPNTGANALELRVKRQTESVCSSADGWRCLCSSREGGGDKAGFQTVCDVAELSNPKWQLNLKVC